MKNCCRILIFCFLQLLLIGNGKAQIWSVETLFTPSSSILYNNASCFGFHIDNWSTFYMRYVDTSYYYGLMNPALWLPTPVSYRINMPQNFVVVDFKKISSRQGFIGSYQGVGMYGWTQGIFSSTSDRLFHIYELPVIDQLNRIVVNDIQNPPLPGAKRTFAIGEKTIQYFNTKPSYILDFCMESYGMSLPYFYAKLSYDPDLQKQEVADDVITLGRYVVFATRDNRIGHAPINLRISDTSGVIFFNTDIDYQWQFFHRPYQQLYGKLRMLSLDRVNFVLSYVIYDTERNSYYLCLHRIDIRDFLSGINTVVSHEIQIEKSCSDLIDMIFEPDVQTMVILLNGVGVSELYHANPYSNVSDVVYKLEYPDVALTSIDTIGIAYSYNVDAYVAMGGNEIFTQEISNGIVIDTSCLDISVLNSLLRPTPEMDCIKDPLERFSDNKQYILLNKPAAFVSGSRICYEYLEKKSQDK